MLLEAVVFSGRSVNWLLQCSVAVFVGPQKQEGLGFEKNQGLSATAGRALELVSNPAPHFGEVNGFIGIQRLRPVQKDVSCLWIERV